MKRIILTACVILLPIGALAAQKDSEPKDVTVKDLKDKGYDCGVTGGGYVCAGKGEIWACEGSGNSDKCTKIRRQPPRSINPARQIQTSPKAIHD
ncbi:hypothetical protein ABGN05_14000 [Aquibium sp. LZ166]|uniref:DUF333 domain-containing protein n=1 Tax=Aquibium pacificus TaxID=3153579 RepID=A0ABV3SLA8_9HYPH